MEQKVIDALEWIIGILDKNSIPYRIGGGFAAHVYGSNRPIKDIDITIPRKYFEIIMPEISSYIKHDLKNYLDEKWDCFGLTLDYFGQEIDITDIDTLQMSSKDKTGWFKTKEHFRKFDTVPTEIAGVTVSLINPRDLIAYKKHLNGDHQTIDIDAVQKYIDRQKSKQ